MSFAHKYIKKVDSIAARLLGEELIVMSATDSMLFSLNAVAAVIFESADGRTPLSRIVEEKICAKFEVEPRQALADAEEFVSEMMSHGIILVSDTPFDEELPSQ